MSWDKVWEDIFKEQEWGKYPPESLIVFIARKFYKKDRPAVKILEIGCGPGANIWYLSREGFDTYGIDGSPTAIALAEERLKKEGFKATLKVGDVTRLPFPDNYFDAVLDVECLSCNLTVDTEKILAEVKRILKTKGLFYSKTFTEKMYVGKSNELMGRLEYKNIADGPLSGKGIIRLVDKKSIKKLYGNRFNVLSVDTLEHTRDNGAIKISEWIIICQKG